MRPQRPALLAWLCAAAGGAQGQSTVSVYLPEYDDSDWAALRGSVLSSDKSVTAYTVFCADQSPTCHIAGELPFVFTEGAHTLVYKGTDPGTLTADLECKLEGKTAATCTGSSSVGSHHREGPLTGPTETVWTKTFAAADVTWGVLTLSTPGPLPDTTDIEDTMLATMTGTAVPTSGARGLLDGESSRRVVMASLGAVVLGLLFG
ncbi:hypothetical protein C8A01DRAFT_19337 [Parachaetomium inaequale]|uniref:Uncharacterized protein n=1 Tax=Parachaetomium inaequale TaxID=2588326 RepID=A0AAN6PBH3_9PEZI|nr:hypothetical protein C8A01DRAFT_19337 [Parachaetomium inaequale]